MVLDGYSRSTDSLMYTIGRSQAQSLTYLSLKECTFLTDKGFETLERFEWLEYLDMSHCRITDKTLDYVLSTYLRYGSYPSFCSSGRFTYMFGNSRL